jgi:nucleoside 2-deoxyribosyltransferase
MTKVYLAGGFHSGWQDKVREWVPSLTFYDPADRDPSVNMSLEEFGTWDLHHVKSCDLVFAYAERTNPSLLGLSVEIGYAAGLGKTVILVLEDDHEHFKDRYMQFLRKAADVTFDDLADAVHYLAHYA